MDPVFPDKAKFRVEYSDECVDLIQGLLHKNNTKRIGAKGYKEVLAHPFFKGFDEVKLLAKDYKPPVKFKHQPKSVEEGFHTSKDARAMRKTPIDGADLARV